MYAKCLVIGDSGVGKTCMAIVNDKKDFPSDYLPTVYSAYPTYPGNDFEYGFVWWDSTGNAEYDRLRQTCEYHGTAIILLCFSVVQPASYESIITRWYPEIKERCPDVPVILAGMKTDLRYDDETLHELRMSNLAPITKEEGFKLSKDINALDYLECSSIMNQGITEIASKILRTITMIDDETKTLEDKNNCPLQ